MQHWKTSLKYIIRLLFVGAILVFFIIKKNTSSEVLQLEWRNDEPIDQRNACFNHLRNALLIQLKSVLKQSIPVILAFTVDHFNLGDHFIWVGQEIILKELNQNVVYRCLSLQCKTNKIEKYLRRDNRTILCFQGGGNFGDLYEKGMRLKLQFVRKFPRQRIIFFPQSVHYQSNSSLARDAKTMTSHPDLHIMARSEDSFDILKERFDQNHTYYLVPDMAFMIGSILPMCEPMYDVIFLKRTDKEDIITKDFQATVLTAFQKEKISYQIFDWFDSLKYISQSPYWTGYRNDNTRPIQALEIANFLLSRGRVIVTDRLHATILSFLIDRPVVYLDNSYGKPRNVVKVLDQWSSCQSFRRCFATDTKTVINCVKSFLLQAPPIQKSQCVFRMRSILPSLLAHLKNTPLY